MCTCTCSDGRQLAGAHGDLPQHEGELCVIDLPVPVLVCRGHELFGILVKDAKLRQGDLQLLRNSRVDVAAEMSKRPGVREGRDGKGGTEG